MTLPVHFDIRDTLIRYVCPKCGDVVSYKVQATATSTPPYEQHILCARCTEEQPTSAVPPDGLTI